MSLPASQNPVNVSVMPASQQKITIPNKFGEKLVGILHETGSVEIVILCHGFRSTKERDIMMNVAVALEKEGITAFRFDFAGNGLFQKSIERDQSLGHEISFHTFKLPTAEFGLPEGCENLLAGSLGMMEKLCLAIQKLQQPIEQFIRERETH
ncbi:unnamed protein product [Camellia sinensis]